jgi:hypothetical protein
MEYTYIQDIHDSGSWLVILGCPLESKHHVFSHASQSLSGPTFATCAACEHQVGKNYQLLGLDNEPVKVYPERLKCGYKGEAADSQLPVEFKI